MPLPVMQFYGDPGIPETLSDTSVVCSFAKETYAPTSLATVFGRAGMAARFMLIQAITEAVNFTLNGTVPTVDSGTNVGMRLEAGQSYVIEGYNAIKNFKCINSVAANGAIVKGIPQF